jgi:ligand-binding sensor domain-containing protein
MTLDGRGNLLLGMGDANVDMFNLASRQVTRISDFRSDPKISQIFTLYNYHDTIYVGTDIGVSSLVYNPGLGRYLIRGNYNNLIAGHPEQPVRTILVHDGYLWAGTNQGLARGDLSAPPLEAPQAWTTFDTDDGLSGNNITAMEIFNGTLYAAASANTSKLNYMQGSGFVTLGVNGSAYISFLRARGDTLYVGQYGGIYRLDDGSLTRYGQFEGRGLALEFDDAGGLWAGLGVQWNGRGGLASLADGSGSNWTFYRPEGPEFEVISDILVEEDGSLWLAGRQVMESFNGALAHFDGRHWVNLALHDDSSQTNPVSPDSFFSYPGLTMTQDQAGNVWVGTDGGGVGWFRWVADTILPNGQQVDSIFANAYYAASSGRLFGVIEDGRYDKYCIVRDLLTDPAGNVWICNSQADGYVSPQYPLQPQPIALVPSDFIQGLSATWFYLTPRTSSGSPLQNAKYYVDRIAQDLFGNKWIGAGNGIGQGLHVLDDGGTLSSDNDQWYELTDLPSNTVNALAMDHNGVMWVGTTAGVRYYYVTENPQELIGYNLAQPMPTSPYIRTITVDPFNNKWFGTVEGLSILASDDYTWVAHYTTADGPFPSPLPGNVINAITFEPRSGNAYIGTDKGLARLSTPFKATGESVTAVTLWPNPFIIGGGFAGRLNFDMLSMASDTKMKIFTASGQFVRQLSTTEIGSGWDGRNSHGDLVGSGIYLLLAYSTNGSARTGKVAVVHQ